MKHWEREWRELRGGGEREREREREQNKKPQHHLPEMSTC